MAFQSLVAQLFRPALAATLTPALVWPAAIVVEAIRRGEGLNPFLVVGALLVGAVGIVVAMLHFMLIALPLYLWIESRRPVRFWMCPLAGAAIGGLTMPSLFGWPSQAPWWPLLLATLGLLGGFAFGLARPEGRVDADRPF